MPRTVYSSRRAEPRSRGPRTKDARARPDPWRDGMRYEHGVRYVGRYVMELESGETRRLTENVLLNQAENE